jgi:proteasome lid subunit RPN8/RPN11
MTSTSTYSDKPGSDDVARPPAKAAVENTAQDNRPRESEPRGSEPQEPQPEESQPPVSTAGEPRSILLHGAKPAAGQVRVAISQLSLRQIEGHASRDLTRELGGVLLGEVGNDEAGFIVKVRATLPVHTDDHGPVHFTFTADSWAQLHEERARRYPELDIVGWYHTHPNLGVFYSADDVIVHQAAFVMPWQVGLVYDPVRGEGCLVGWDGSGEGNVDAKLSEIDGYYEVLDEQIGSVVSWQFLRSSVWREGAYRSEAMPSAGHVHSPPNAKPALPPISPWWGVLIGGLSLLITLLLLIDRLLAGTP